MGVLNAFVFFEPVVRFGLSSFVLGSKAVVILGDPDGRNETKISRAKIYKNTIGPAKRIFSDLFSPLMMGF